MNKIAIYILLTLIFLTASRAVTPRSQVTKYIFNESNYSNLFQGSPLTVILEDAYQFGFIIKNNLHRYRVIRVFEPTQIVTTRVSKEYFKKTLEYIGLSLFRRNEKGVENTIPVPPGSLFIGHPGYGRWKLHKDGVKYWTFVSNHDSLQKKFLWGNFIPNNHFYRELNIHLKNKKKFLGPENEFGSKGPISQSQLPMKWYRNHNKKFSLNDHIKAIRKIPLIRIY